MSKHANKDKNKALEDLLKKAGRPQDLDAFEKDALEGFNSLPASEAFKLQEQTDRRVQEQLFAPAPRRSYGFWWAAAVFVLLFGIGTYLIRREGTGNKDLALQRPVEDRNEVLSPAGAPAENKLAEDHKEKEIKKEPGDLPAISSKKESREKNQAEPETRSQLKQKAARVSENEANAAAAQANPPAEDQPALVAGAVREDALVEAPASTALSEKPVQPAAKKARHAIEAAPAAMADKDALSRSLVEYQGGEEQLARDLKELFRQKNLPPFDALVYVKAPGLVEKVILKEDSDLSGSQKKEVIRQILKISKFKVNLPEGQTASYNLLYRP